MKSLLDDLCVYLRKEYISDLKNLNSIDKFEAVKFFRKTKASDYSIFSWNDAHAYITGHHHDEVFPEEARVKLIECLKK